MLQQAWRNLPRFSVEKSFDTFREIIDRYPDYEGFEETVARQFEIAEALMQGARANFYNFPWL